MANYTGTEWKTKTCLSTDLLSQIDEGLGQVIDDVKNLNADLTDINIFSLGTQITGEVDLNDYETPGNYYVSSSTYASQITNGPVTNTGYKLLVLNTAGSTRWIQIAFVNASANPIMFRTKTGDSTITAWRTVSFT